MKNIIHQSETIYKYLEKINITKIFGRIAVKHMMSIIISAFMLGYKGKTVNFERNSECHRTTVAHFLNEGKWEEKSLESVIKSIVIEKIYSESKRTGEPIYCIVDDTITSKTKPSSQALHPIEDAYFHQSHLKKRQDYGHQAVGVMLSCNGITLNYAVVMYDKTKSKIKIVQEIAAELPEAPVKSYLLCDSWYTSKKITESFAEKGFYTIGALRTNRIIYPCGTKMKISEFASCIRQPDLVRLVTVGSRQYFVYRYEGKLNGVDNAVVLITYPCDVFFALLKTHPEYLEKTLRAFICTDTSLSTDEILEIYAERWEIELFFRQSKNVLALDKYQIRSSRGIKRFWLIMSLVHLMCCTGTNDAMDFAHGFAFFQQKLQHERIAFIYQCARDGIAINTVLDLFA